MRNAMKTTMSRSPQRAPCEAAAAWRTLCSGCRPSSQSAGFPTSSASSAWSWARRRRWRPNATVCYWARPTPCSVRSCTGCWTISGCIAPASSGCRGCTGAPRPRTRPRWVPSTPVIFAGHLPCVAGLRIICTNCDHFVASLRTNTLRYSDNIFLLLIFRFIVQLSQDFPGRSELKRINYMLTLYL